MSTLENAQILEVLRTVPEFSEPHHLRSRRVGSVAVIEVHVRVEPEMTVRSSHALASRVERGLHEAFGADAIVTIHVEPRKASVAEREQGEP